MTYYNEGELNQTLVYWSESSLDNYGNRKPSTPVEITARIETSNNEVQTEGGEVILSDLTVYTDTVLTVGTLCWVGALADLPVSNTKGDVLKVIKSYIVPDLEGLETIRYYDLARSKDIIET